MAGTESKACFRFGPWRHTSQSKHNLQIDDNRF